MNIFDHLQDSVINIVTDTMGYLATWYPSGGGSGHTGFVLYNGPTEKEELLNVNFKPHHLRLEYKAGLFAGLKEAADDNRNEIMSIQGIGEFYVRSVSAKFDGKTFEAFLEAKTL